MARKLADCRPMACAAPEYLAAAGVPWSFTDDDGHTTEVTGHCRFQANNTEGMLEVALAGVGVAYGPSFVFAKHLERGELIPVLADFRNPVLPLHAITPCANHVTLKTKRFIDQLRLAFAAPAPWERWMAATA